MDIRVVKVVKDFKDVGLNEDDSGYQDVKDFMDVGIKQMNQVWHQYKDFEDVKDACINWMKLDIRMLWISRMHVLIC